MHVDLTLTNSLTWDYVETPDGVRWFPAGSRLKRAAIDELIASGTPLVISWFGGGQLDWYTGDDATVAWSSRRDSFTTDANRLVKKRLLWTGALLRTQDLEQKAVLLTGHC